MVGDQQSGAARGKVGPVAGFKLPTRFICSEPISVREDSHRSLAELIELSKPNSDMS